MLFFLHLVLPLDVLLASSDSRFINEFSEFVGVGCFCNMRSPAEKLADCRKAGLNIRPSGAVCDKGGGGGRRIEAET